MSEVLASTDHAPDPLDLHVGTMVHRGAALRCVFEGLWPDGDKRWDDELRTIDGVLEDDEFGDFLAAAPRRPAPGEPSPRAARHDAAESDATPDGIRDSSIESRDRLYRTSREER